MHTPAALLDAVIKTLTFDKGELLISPWFSDVQPVTIRDGVLIVAAPNELVRDTLCEQFTDNVADILRDFTGKGMTPLYILGGDVDKWRDGNDDVVFEKYSFEHFIVGSSNKFAHAAAVAVAGNPATLYNPLFIYGDSGLGKTHLLYAIAGELRKSRPGFNIVYKKGDDFTVELVEDIKNGTMAEFRSKYRRADLLLIDDIQFIAGKVQTQEEFFHTFNSLHEAGKQVVLTSDRPPKEIASLADRLRTRFEAGLLADIQSPDLETRMALIHEKGVQCGIRLKQSFVDYIAESITNNVRELEGVVRKISGRHTLMGEEITQQLVAEAVEEIKKSRPGLNPTPDLIIDEVSKFYDIPKDRITGNSRTRDILVPRQVTAYLIRELTRYSLPEIGKFLNQHHTTIMHSINKLTEQMKQDSALSGVVDDLRKNIQNR